MLTAHRLTADNVQPLRSLYQQFSSMAATAYRWDTPAIPWDVFQFALHKELIAGIGLLDDSRPAQDPYVGFCLYKVEEHRAVEINVIHLAEGVAPKTALDALMKQLIGDICQRDDWDVVSYALLGRQADFVLTLPWYGFKPMGQCIVKFDMLDPLASQIFKNQEALPPLAEPYRLVHWDHCWADQVAEVVYEAFHTKSDALWDPRFRSLEGGRDVVRLITTHEMGTHLPTCTSLLLSGNQVVGFCFLLQTDVTVGNIPLIGLRPEVAGQGLGNQLIRHTMRACIQQIIEHRIGMAEINATLDTDNHAAIHMYRRFGFAEVDNYPHAYLTRDKALAYKPGQWC